MLGVPNVFAAACLMHREVFRSSFGGTVRRSTYDDIIRNCAPINAAKADRRVTSDRSLRMGKTRSMKIRETLEAKG